MKSILLSKDDPNLDKVRNTNLFEEEELGQHYEFRYAEKNHPKVQQMLDDLGYTDSSQWDD